MLSANMPTLCLMKYLNQMTLVIVLYLPRMLCIILLVLKDLSCERYTGKYVEQVKEQAVGTCIGSKAALKSKEILKTQKKHTL